MSKATKQLRVWGVAQEKSAPLHWAVRPAQLPHDTSAAERIVTKQQNACAAPHDTRTSNLNARLHPPNIVTNQASLIPYKRPRSSDRLHAHEGAGSVRVDDDGDE